MESGIASSDNILTGSEKFKPKKLHLIYSDRKQAYSCSGARASEGGAMDQERLRGAYELRNIPLACFIVMATWMYPLTNNHQLYF